MDLSCKSRNRFNAEFDIVPGTQQVFLESQTAQQRSKDSHRVFNKGQVDFLNEFFKKQMYPSHSDLEKLAKQLAVETKSIKLWFQNRRSKAKKQPLAMNEATDDMQPLDLSMKPTKQINHVEPQTWQLMTQTLLPPDHPFCNLELLTSGKRRSTYSTPTARKSRKRSRDSDQLVPGPAEDSNSSPEPNELHDSTKYDARRDSSSDEEVSDRDDQVPECGDRSPSSSPVVKLTVPLPTLGHNYLDMSVPMFFPVSRVPNAPYFPTSNRYFYSGLNSDISEHEETRF